jgi:tetratricopeptide (TPR) repeat protein
MDLPAEQQQALDRAIDLHGSGDLAAAETLYRAVLEACPDQADALHYLGVIALQSGRFDEAIDLIQRAIDVQPDFVGAIVNLAHGLNATEQYEAAVEQFEAALKLQPDLTDTRRNLADTLLRMGRVENAIERYQQVLEARPDAHDVRRNIARALRSTGRSEDAVEQYTALLEQDSGNAETHHELGALYQDLNRKDEALAAYRKAVEIDVTCAKAWHGMSAVSKSAFADSDVDKIREVQANAGLGVERRMLLAFALGKHFENTGKHEGATAQYLLANQITRAELNYDIKSDIHVFDNLKSRFDKVFLERWADVGSPDTSPIFIVGMHRSGTTLVEQILASHPRVFGAGEIALLTQSILQSFPITEGNDYTSGLKDASAEDFQAVARNYLAGRPPTNAEFITDKLPHNFLNVGMIRILFPNAKIMHCRRDPRDTCFSIFKNLFGQFAYTFDLKELGHYYNEYAALMKHWETVMPGVMHTVQYESMVNAQEKTTRELLDACGLEWDSTCLDFHKHDRAIPTISATQARQPVYRSSMNAWKAYEEMLMPLLEVLESDIDERAK